MLNPYPFYPVRFASFFAFIVIYISLQSIERERERNRMKERERERERERESVGETDRLTEREIE